MHFVMGWAIGAGTMWAFIELQPPPMILGFIYFFTVLVGYALTED